MMIIAAFLLTCSFYACTFGADDQTERHIAIFMNAKLDNLVWCERQGDQVVRMFLKKEYVTVSGPQRFYKETACVNKMIGIISGESQGEVDAFAIRMDEAIMRYKDNKSDQRLEIRKILDAALSGEPEWSSIQVNCRSMKELCHILLPVDILLRCVAESCDHRQCNTHWIRLKKQLEANVDQASEKHEALVLVPHKQTINFSQPNRAAFDPRYEHEQRWKNIMQRAPNLSEANEGIDGMPIEDYEDVL